MIVDKRDPGRIVVTGAAGFLGAAVVARLRAEGRDVVATDVAPGVGIVACDVTDLAAIEAVIAPAPVGTVLHLGGVSGPMVLPDDPVAVMRINTIGTVQVLEAARRHKVGRVVVASSVDVYGDAPGILDEATPLRPVTVYGASKVAAEAAVRGYRMQHRLDAIALRLGWLYGPGRRTPTTLAQVFCAALSGTPITVPGNPADITHHLALEDAVEGVIAATLAAAPSGTAFNITAGDGRTFADVVAAIDAHRPVRVAYDGSPHEPGPQGFDQDRAEAELGFVARIGLAEGMGRTLAGFAVRGSCAPLAHFQNSHRPRKD